MEDRYCRAEVIRFARMMEERLRADGYEGTRPEKPVNHWINRLFQEYVDLELAAEAGRLEEVVHRAADVANVAMFIADVVTAQREG